MAVAIDTVTSSSTFTTSTGTFSHTVSGTDTYLIVAVSVLNDGENITGVTYNGVAMSKLVEAVSTGTSNSTELWGLVNPASGANNVVVSKSGTGWEARATALSYTGVDQTNPVNNTGSATVDSSGSISATVATTVGNCMLVEICGNNWNETITGSNGQTYRTNVLLVTSNFYYRIGDRITAPVVSNVETWTDTDGFDDGMSLAIVALAPTLGDYDIVPIGSPLEFDTGLFEGGNFFQYDATHYILVYSGSAQDGYIGVFETDGTGNVTSSGTPFEFDTTQGGDPCIEQVDSTHYIVWWKGTDGDGFVQVMTLNTGTWTFTAEGTPLEFETLQYTDGASRQVNSNHFLFTWAGDGTDGFAQIFTVNTSTWAVTAEGTALEHDTSRGDQNALVTLDSTHYMLCYSGVGSDGFAQVLEVNTSTWAVTETGTALEFDTTVAEHISAVAINSSKVLVFWRGSTGIGRAQVLSVDGSWNVSTAGSVITFESTVTAAKNNSVFLLKDNIYINAWGGTDDDGFVRAFSVNLTDWTITPLGTSALEFDATNGTWSCGVKVSDSRFILAWSGTDLDGFIQGFNINVTEPLVVRATTTPFATSVTSMPVTLPPVMTTGHLLLAFVEVRNSGTWTVPTDWTEFVAQIGGGSVGELTGFYKIIDGTEGATATWTASTGTTATWQVLMVTDWHGTTPPEDASTSGDATTADPPSLTPSWGSADTLWIVIGGHTAGVVDAFTAAPTDYTDFLCTGASSGGAAVSLATAYRELTASSEDPGTFTVSNNRFWAAATVGVRPVGGDPPATTGRTNRILLLGVS